MEEAARSLGASNFQTFRRIVLPNLMPAILSGAALSFGKAVGEFGSIILISGNIPFHTEVASVNIFKAIESDDPGGAAAVSVVLLVLLARRARSPPTCSIAAAGGTVHSSALSRYTIRFVALGYLALVLVLPLSVIFFRTFQDGLGPVIDSLTDPALHARAAADADRRRDRGARRTPSSASSARSRSCAATRRAAHWFFNSAIGLPLALSPIVVGLSLILVYGQQGWLGSWLLRPRDPGDLLARRESSSRRSS